MRVDVAASTVEVAGRSFPACVLRCPDDEDYPHEPRDRVLGGKGKLSAEVFVPLESGVLVAVEREDSTGDLFVAVKARTCERVRDFDFDGGTSWLPWSLRLDGKALVVAPGFTPNSWWARCEEWWVAEQLSRLADMSYEEPSGPSVDLLRLHEVGGWDV